ncbi:MAG: hypothetical protein A2081_00885 [Elusimicrobia bacterium GWC2_61_19]|nr:MAG: hypothetical protein A2081_00885 [Elusimicrobia bacterium GWC2_61_19]
MKKIFILPVLVLAVGAAACKKRAPETVPQPKAEDTAAAVVSTGPVKAAGLTAASGNYLKATVGHVGEAKAAKTLFEKTAQQGLDGLNLDKTGGN